VYDVWNLYILKKENSLPIQLSSEANRIIKFIVQTS